MLECVPGECVPGRVELSICGIVDILADSFAFNLTRRTWCVLYSVALLNVKIISNNIPAYYYMKNDIGILHSLYTDLLIYH